MALGNHKVEIIVGVKDLATRSLNSIQRSVTSMSGNVSRGFNSLGTGIGAFTRNLDASARSLDKMANSMYKFNMYTSSLQRNLRNVGLIGAGVAGTLAYQGASQAVSFDYKSHVMQSRMEVPSNVRKDIEKYVLNTLSLKSSSSPSAIMDTGIVLGQAGISNAKDMKSLLKTTTYFSEAVDAPTDQAGEMIVAAAKGFNISMQKSTSISDKLTVALNKSLLHTDELPHAIGELSGRAPMYGQSLDSSLVALMSMRDQGMSAAQGSQDLLNALRSGSRIGNSSTLYKKSQSYFNELGIGDGIFNKSTKKLKEYPELIADIEKSMVKSGFTNNKYGIKNMDDYHNYLNKNGGKAPEDFWNAMKVMPLITKVFGAAGQAPILMGLQTKYEETNKKGEKTGKTYYGSEALKKMYNEVKNSDGATERTHKIIADSSQYQLSVMKNAWQGIQIKFMDNLLPAIKTGAQQLTGYLSGKSSGNPLGKFRASVEKSADNFDKQGHHGTATIVRETGNGIIGGVQIAGTMPSLFNQIGTAANKDLIKGNWGSNIATFPAHLVHNGIKFITDLLGANKEFNAAVSKLPKNLQDPANLVEKFIKGGLILLMTGAIIKVVELSIRAASAGLKTGKGIASFGKTVIGWMTGKNGKGSSPINDLTKTINANIVNVYGKTINNAGGGTPGAGGKGSPPVILDRNGHPINGGGTGHRTILDQHGNPIRDTPPAPTNSTWSKLLKGGGTLLTKVPQVAIPAAVMAILASTVINRPKYTGNKALTGLVVNESKGVKINNLNDLSKKVVDGNTKGLTSYIQKTMPKEAAIAKKVADQVKSSFVSQSTKGKNPLAGTGLEKFQQYNNKVSQGLVKKQGDINTSIVKGFNTANKRLHDVKLQNQINVNVAAPSVNISGNIKDVVNVKSSGSKYNYTAGSNSGETDYERMNKIMDRRLGW